MIDILVGKAMYIWSQFHSVRVKTVGEICETLGKTKRKKKKFKTFLTISWEKEKCKVAKISRMRTNIDKSFSIEVEISIT